MDHDERMDVMREVVAWLRGAPAVDCMAPNPQFGLARSTRSMTATEAADELERQVEAGTA